MLLLGCARLEERGNRFTLEAGVWFTIESVHAGAYVEGIERPFCPLERFLFQHQSTIYGQARSTPSSADLRKPTIVFHLRKE